MSLFSEMEKSIEQGFRRWTERAFGPTQSGELLLLHRAILEEIAGKVQTMARGKRVFPYPRLTVTLVSSDADRRALYQAALRDRLPGDIRGALEAARCEVPRGFTVEMRTAETGPRPFGIEYGVPSGPDPRPVAALARLLAVRGKMQRDAYVLEQPRVNIGRMVELMDSDQRVIRRNDVVFEEGADEANATVSRCHAHIFVEEGEYRICDDGSEFGTRVFREGRSLEVPPGNPRGERLRPGDEIYLGRACVRFERE